MRTLTVDQRQAIAQLAKEELSRRYYRDYVEYVHHNKYRHFRHTELVCKELQRVADGEQRYIMIEMPPRHGKSMTVTETFPSFYIGKNPEKRVIVASYSDSLARSFGRKNRDKVNEFAPQLFKVDLSNANKANNDWSIEGKNGGMVATGIGGSITGKGADLLIIDDPYKNAEEANSDTIRQKVWNEWESTLSTRLHDGASVIVIMTRWHEDDIIGRLLKHSPRNWSRLRLPAIAEEEDDLLNREIGEALCPELGFDEKWAEEKKREVGSRTWASLFQQQPSPSDGNIFNRSWWKYYKVLPSRFDEMIQSWDCTFKDNKDSDYVVGQVWGRLGADKYLIAQVRGQMNLPATIQAIRNLTAAYPLAYAKLVEDKANGPAVIQMLSNEIPGLIPVNPEGGKVVRATAASPDVEAGNVYLPDPTIAPWINDFVEEAAAFPNGANDDQVDGFTQAIIRFNQPKEFTRIAMPSLSGWNMKGVKD
ncbi:phage terminase large subunit [Neobacillus sp. MM2021_6]|uniref:phage terminase large subunit n=1 Tax=Bacillaceae TaxID=186817 RepID=UPI0014097325|nr:MULTISPECIES: phage terminase large subunit [Bacillaceae]MBO0962352.1 phage terminase large subunit [Neobacillus sp. MM2021_6]NHC20835.1 phage terminase large subunit [Bacillus sp. MM2020_4]